MAIINLSNDKISSLSTEIESLDSTLLGSYLPELSSVVGEIKGNVLNEQINQILGTISSQIETISGELKTDLPKLEQFLNKQMTEYKTSEADAEAKVNAVLSRMESFAKNITITASATGTTAMAADMGASNSTTDSNNNTSTESDYSHGWGEKYSETWGSWWGDVKEAYTGGGGTHGLLSGTVNTVEAACDTVGALVETVGNGLSDTCHIVGNVVGWLAG